MRLEILPYAKKRVLKCILKILKNMFQKISRRDNPKITIKKDKMVLSKTVGAGNKSHEK